MEITINLGEVQEAPESYGELGHSGQVIETVKPLLETGREVFIVLYLNLKQQVLKRELHSIGGSGTSPIYVKELCRAALLCQGCIQVVFIHNHLAGGNVPSLEDRRITEQLSKALGLFNLRVMDHLIYSVPDKNYYSFADNREPSIARNSQL